MNDTAAPIKVNAWVERGVAPLVAAMNEFAKVWTTSSGEGNGHGDFVHVHFAYRGASNQFAKFMRTLSSELSSRVQGDNEYRLALEWVAGGKEPLGAVMARREVVQPLSEALRRIAASFVRTSQSQRGTRGRAPRNSTAHRARRRFAP